MIRQAQAISLLALPVKLQQDTPAGTWVSATGNTVSATELPFGITQRDGVANEVIGVTVAGTASMNLEGLATSTVNEGDAVCYADGAMSVKTAAQAATAASTVSGILLHKAGANGHVEVLLK